MNDPGRPISEEELQALVDDRLDHAQLAYVARYVQEHPDVARRVAAYRDQREALRKALASVTAEPLPPATRSPGADRSNGLPSVGCPGGRPPRSCLRSSWAEPADGSCASVRPSRP